MRSLAAKTRGVGDAITFDLRLYEKEVIIGDTWAIPCRVAASGAATTVAKLPEQVG